MQIYEWRILSHFRWCWTVKLKVTERSKFAGLDTLFNE